MKLQKNFKGEGEGEVTFNFEMEIRIANYCLCHVNFAGSVDFCDISIRGKLLFVWYHGFNVLFRSGKHAPPPLKTKQSEKDV